MADATSHAAEAAAEAAKVTTEHIEAVQQNADDVIERAAERVEAANEAAQAIADAAIMTELGQQISAMREEVITWRGQQENRLSILEAKISAMETLMTETSQQTSQLIQQLATLSLIQPQSEAPPAAPIAQEVTTLDPSSAVADVQKAAETVTEKVKRRVVMT